jgi:DNA polymerase III subunit gamma/tau
MHEHRSYVVFARKYRPKTFDQMIGQTAVVQTLQNALKARRVAQAYLFSGMRGVGKTTAARILAKSLNCTAEPELRPCNHCESCVEIDEDRSIDVLEIDGASNRGIDDIRALREAVKYKALRGRYKVIIIDEVHQVTGPAFNALLKTLEEPPPHTIFIFATTEFHKVPATIVSRCQHFEFKKVAQGKIINHLQMIATKENLTILPSGLALIANASEGSIRDALSLLDQAVAFCGDTVTDGEIKEILGTINTDLLFEFSTAIFEERADRIFGLVEKVMDSGYDLRPFYKELVHHFRNLLLVSTIETPGDLLLATAEELARLKDESRKVSSDDLLRYLQALQNAEPALKFASSPQTLFETALVKLCHFRKLVDLGELIQGDVVFKKAGTPVVPERPKMIPGQSSPSPTAGFPSPKPVERSPLSLKPKPLEPPPPPVAPIATSGSSKSDKEMDLALKDPGVRLFLEKTKSRIVAVEPLIGKPDSEEP